MSLPRTLPLVLALIALGACAARPTVPPGGSARPGYPSAALPPGSLPAPTQPPPAYPPAARQFRLGAAATALVAQAHAQAQAGEYPAAGATLERALRIEPDNPLLWVELGRLQLAGKNPAQADGMGRKALALAQGDASAQASAWRLIADSLRAQGRNPEAADADRHGATLVPR